MDNKNSILFMIFACLAVVLVAGCTSTVPATSATITLTPTPQIIYVTVTVTPSPPITMVPTTSLPIVASGNDPILGSWSGLNSAGTLFLADFRTGGDYYGAFSTNNVPGSHYIGMWKDIGNNQYTTTVGTDTEHFTYIPSSDTLVSALAPSTPLTRAGVTVAPTPAPTPSTVAGTGDSVVTVTSSGSGLIIFTSSYSGSDNYIVWLMDSQGNKLDLVANEIGPYSGSTSEHLDEGTYYLNIRASGPWTITMTST